MKKLIYLFALLGFASTSVHATTFNYAEYADGIDDGSVFTNNLVSSGLGESGYEWYSVTKGGITVTATGTATNDDDQAQYAYLDSGDAGLGVCKDFGGASTQCWPTNDDNVTQGETLVLTFDQEVILNTLNLVNGSHGTNFSGVFDILVNDSVLYDDLTLSSLLSGLNMSGTSFKFISQAVDAANNLEQFYINSMDVSAVPVPAAGILFASALLGAGALGRRKKKATKVSAFARAS